MVSKETHIFLSPFWPRWEPGLVRKSEVELSATGLPSLLPVSPSPPTVACSYSNSILQTWPALLFLAVILASLLVSVCSLSLFIYLSLCLYRLKHLAKFANSPKIATHVCYSHSTNYVSGRPLGSLLLFPSSQQPCDRKDTMCSSNPFPPPGTTFPSLSCWH